jgi:hypothetical protein
MFLQITRYFQIFITKLLTLAEFLSQSLWIFILGAHALPPPPTLLIISNCEEWQGRQDMGVSPNCVGYTSGVGFFFLQEYVLDKHMWRMDCATCCPASRWSHAKRRLCWLLLTQSLLLTTGGKIPLSFKRAQFWSHNYGPVFAQYILTLLLVKV